MIIVNSKAFNQAKEKIHLLTILYIFALIISFLVMNTIRQKIF